VEIDLTRPKRSEIDILRSGEDWSSYSAQYDGLVAAEFAAARVASQRAAEARRLSAIDAAYERQRKEEMNWSPIQIGLSIHCPSCAAAIFISGTWADGTDSTNPDQPHCWRESYEDHVVLTTPPCNGCRRRALIDLGKLSHEAPRTFSSLMTMKTVFGFVVSAAIPKPSETQRKPIGVFRRLLGSEG
jgi:hypothetical protein